MIHLHIKQSVINKSTYRVFVINQPWLRIITIKVHFPYTFHRDGVAAPMLKYPLNL